MGTKITRHIDLSSNKKWLNATEKSSLKEIIESSFSGISATDYLDKYFYDQKAFNRKLRLFYDHKKLVGYCLLTFTRVEINNHDKVVCIGASAAFYPAYRHGNHTIAFSVKEAFKYAFIHPLDKVYYADTMLSPAMYRVVAKNVGIIYPHERVEQKGGDVPEEVVNLVKKLNPDTTQEESSKYFSHRIYVARNSNYCTQDIARFVNSDKPEIAFYCKINPQFNDGYAVLTIVPVSLKQLIKTLLIKFKFLS